MTALLLCLLAAAEEDAFEGVGFPPLSAPLTDPVEITDRVDDLAGILRCPVCQGMTVADSNEESSLAMKERIREMVAAGYTDDQIRDYFVDRYGEGIVLLPDQRHWMVWLFPLLVFGVGGGMVFARARKRPAPTRPEVKPIRDEEDAYRAAILAELED